MKKDRKRTEADDDPGPALMTPRRLAAQVEAAAMDVSRALGRLDALAVYTESRIWSAIADELGVAARSLNKLRGLVLSGQIAIIEGRDDQSWQRRMPLIAAIESKAPADGDEAVIEGGSIELPWEPPDGVTPDPNDPWLAPLSALGLPGGVVRLLVRQGKISTVKQLAQFDDLAPLTSIEGVSQEIADQVQTAIQVYRKQQVRRGVELSAETNEFRDPQEAEEWSQPVRTAPKPRLRRKKEVSNG